MNIRNSFAVTILGNASAVPTANRNLTSQLVQYGTNRFLVDCGEGTQLQMIKFRVKQTNLNHIFISHLHGDHFYGLFGLISTFHLFGRTKPLAIFAPQALKDLLDHVLQVSNTTLRFELNFHNLEDFGDKPVYENDHFKITCFPVVHRIPTWGFKFEEKHGIRKINKAFLAEYAPDIATIKAIKAGDGYKAPNGKVYSHNEITEAPLNPRSYVYCADTAYDTSLAPYLFGADLVYHEATFDDSMEALAIEKFHATARHAALQARQAQVKKLLLGHFSARHTSLEGLLEEARSVFENTLISEEGIRYPVE